MSKSGNRQKRRARHQPHWIAVRTLLTMFSMKMNREGVYGERKTEPPGYVLRRADSSQAYLGRVRHSASLDEWTTEVVAADKRKSDPYAQMWNVPHGKHTYQRRVGKSLVLGSAYFAKIEARIAAKMGVHDEAHRIDSDEGVDIQQPDPAPRRYGPQLPHRLAKANRPPRRIR